MSQPLAITQDTMLGGKVHIFQLSKGFRAGTDSVLLGASVAELPLKGARAIDIGCGAGGALFPAAWHLPEVNFIGLERDGDMADLARRGIAANSFETRIEVIEGDLAEFAKTHENAFDLVFSNPPYFQTGHISSPAPGKAEAYIESLSLDDWLKAMLFLAAPKGQIVLIHRAAELARILARLDRQAGEITVLPIRPYAGAKASRVLVRAKKGLRTGDLTLLDGLDLHASKGGELTARASQILQGAQLDWV